MPAPRLQYGLQLPLGVSMDSADWEFQAGAQAIIAIARRAEQLGYAHVGAADHIAMPKARFERLGPRWLDPFTTLAYVAAATHKIQLFTFVAVVPFRNPLALAKTVATLDFLSGGRFIFGVGIGVVEQEFAALGVPFQKRGLVTNEFLRAMKELWTSDVVSFHGQYCDFNDVVSAPRPIQKPHPPIWIAAGTDAALRRAAALGDGWVSVGLTPEQVQERLSYLRGLPEFATKAATFEVTVSLRLHGHQSPVGDAVDLVRGFQQAGATRVHLGLTASSRAEYLEHMQWFAEEVMARIQ